MEITTLMDLHYRLHYLEEDATLPELLEFLGMRYFEGSKQEGNEDRDIYEFVDDCTIAVEVLLKESKVRIYSKLNAYTGFKEDKFWDILFETHLDVLSRLLEVLEEEYSYLGSITFEYFTCGKFQAFYIDCGPRGYDLYWN